MKPLVCLPVYNEEESIANVIKQVQSLGLDLIVVDGYSTDNTVMLATKMGAEVLKRPNKGKGSAVKKGLQIAHERGYDFIFFVDCDETYPVEELATFKNYSDFDLIIGCRAMKDIEVKRRVANRIMNATVNILFRASLKDIASGMRALRVSKFIGYATAESFDIEPQISTIALRERFTIKEIDINYYARVGESKVSPFDFFTLLWRIVLERLK